MELNKAGLAEALGVSTVAVDGWIRRSCPVKERGSKGVSWVFVLADVVAWLNERNTGESADLAKERALLAREQRKKTTLERKRIERELIPAEEVKLNWLGMVSNMRARLLALPSRMAPMVAGMTKAFDIEQAIREEVYIALTELSEGPDNPPHIQQQIDEFEQNYDLYGESSD